MKRFYTADPKDAYRLALEGLAGDARLIVVQNDEVCVWTGAIQSFDLEECERRGIAVAYGEYIGGSIVCMPGDLSVMRIHWGTDDWIVEFGRRVYDWLAGLGLDVVRSDNDLLADGKKIFSWARATTKEGWCQSVAHFSIGPMDLELVKAICTKEMVKMPGALSDYGITAEDALLEFGLY